MISDLDTYRAANVLIRQCGKDATLEAAMQADARLEILGSDVILLQRP